MRKRNVLVDERAVSPVIATILMVAITVVLAATLYMMLPGDNGPVTPVAGSLNYRSADSTATTAVFRMSLSTPSQPSVDSVTVRVFDAGGERVISISGTEISDTAVEFDEGDHSGQGTVRIRHRVSTIDDYIASGDEIILETTEGSTIESFEDWEVIVTFSGYSGEISDTV